jgi:predicted O-methyltransferase YrrM
MYDFQEAKRRVTNVQGWVRKGEDKFLYDQALASVENGVIVEIGAWKGKSTILMACALKQCGQGKLYTIDPFGRPEGFEIEHEFDLWAQQKQDKEYFTDFMQNIRDQNVDDVIVPIKAVSEDAIKIYQQKYNEPISFLFIDGCHKPEFVQRDFDLWSPLVIKGGIIAFHDGWRTKDFKRSPAIIAHKELIESPNFENKQTKGIVWGQKLCD